MKRFKSLDDLFKTKDIKTDAEREKCKRDIEETIKKAFSNRSNSILRIADIYPNIICVSANKFKPKELDDKAKEAVI